MDELSDFFAKSNKKIVTLNFFLIFTVYTNLN